MQSQTGRPERTRVPFEACPLCAGSNWRELRIADCTKHPLYKPVVPKKMRWLECTACKHVYTDGYFSPELLSIIFAKAHENQTPGYKIDEQRLLAARIVARVKQHAPIGKWIDVGFGNGALLLTAEEWGFEPIGLDLRKSSVDGMKKLGIEAHCHDIADMSQIEGVTVVSMADVLEHMPYPAKGLEAARRLLMPYGVLFVSMPHYNCATWRVLDAANDMPYWMELEHYHNFSRDRLYALLRDSGFEPVSYDISERYRVCMEVIARRRA